jgi:hypothetical protein
VLLEPVDHEFEGQSENGSQPVLYARVIESPVDAIEFGYAAEAAGTTTSATAAARTPRTLMFPPRLTAPGV